METTEDPHKNAERFSEALFTYLWFTENLVSGSTAAETLGEMSEIVTEAAKAVVVLSALTVPSFNLSMDDFFKRNEMTRRNVFTFITVYCFSHHQMNDDIFAVVLNTCTFIYRLVIFCQHKGRVEYIEFASMCWNELFHVDLKDEFYAKGGWDEFERYLKERRYALNDKKADPKIFAKFLKEINYLFPKLDIANDKGYNYVFSPAAALAELEAAATVSLLASKNNDCCELSGDAEAVRQAITEDDPDIEESTEDNRVQPPELSCCSQHHDLVGKSEDPASDADSSCDSEMSSEEEDSDEELFHELLHFGLESVSRLHAKSPASGCVVCQGGGRTCKEGDKVCLKHHPDSFYYLVTQQPSLIDVQPSLSDLCQED